MSSPPPLSQKSSSDESGDSDPNTDHDAAKSKYRIGYHFKTVNAEMLQLQCPPETTLGDAVTNSSVMFGTNATFAYKVPQETAISSVEPFPAVAFTVSVPRLIDNYSNILEAIKDLGNKFEAQKVELEAQKVELEVQKKKTGVFVDYLDVRIFCTKRRRRGP